jgi:hypothetical protein
MDCNFEKGHVPRILHADNEFRAVSLLALCETFGVRLISSEPYCITRNESNITISGKATV